MLGLCEFENGDNVFNIDECENSIFVCYTPTVVHELFYLLLKMNQLHNQNVRNDNTRITQFDIHNLTIQENTSYYDVASTIQTLNTNRPEDNSVATPYIYHGQTIHRLAHEYYEKHHHHSRTHISLALLICPLAYKRYGYCESLFNFFMFKFI